MSLLSRIVPLAAVVLAAGCIDTIEPVAISLSIEPTFVENGDGTCTGRVTASATGAGSAEWQEVVLSRGSTVQLEYSGDEVADFWGSTVIRAGQAQTSTAFVVPATATDVTLYVRYGLGGSSSEATLRMDCASDA